MRSYLSGSPMMPVAASDERPSAASGQPAPWAHSALVAHVPGIDGWCVACLAAGLWLLSPCPQANMAQRAYREQTLAMSRLRTAAV